MLQHNSTAIYIPDGQTDIKITYQHHISNDRDSPYILFLHGLMSDMQGTKSQFLLEFCIKNNLNFLAFDNLGHGQSSGEFTAQTIGSWLHVTELMLQQISAPVIIVGSSMGAWLALLAAQNPKYHQQIIGLITLAAAPDFTETIWNYIGDDAKHTLQTKGISMLPNKDGSYHFPISYQLITEARKHLLLTQESINIQCSTVLLHGSNDTEVSPNNSVALMQQILSNNITYTLINGADHRLSDPISLRYLAHALISMINI